MNMSDLTCFEFGILHGWNIMAERLKRHDELKVRSLQQLREHVNHSYYHRP
jgi:hypothetical protein